MDIPGGTLIAQHSGLRFLNYTQMPKEFIQDGDPFKQNGCFCDGVRFDIPKGYEDIRTYNCSMAHKINHSFDNHVSFTCVSIRGCQTFATKIY